MELYLYNVNHIITYHKRWIDFFGNDPTRYEEVYTFGEKIKKKVYVR